MEASFHRSDLPSPAISFSSSEGKKLFAEALSEGYLEGYFHLAEHFITQGKM
jgi:glutathione gamma-glutamylcysteinyltransferase